MNAMHVSLAIFAIILAFGAFSASALECHVCNTKYEGDKCGDPFDTEEFLVDCNEWAQKNAPELMNATMCRKQLQTVEGEYRVIRSCAMSGRVDRCFDRTGTKEVKITYCECEGGKCNGAASLAVSFSLVASMILAVFARS